MSIKTSLPYLFAFAAVASYGCSSSSNAAGPTGDGGGGGDGSTISDGGTTDGGGGIDGMTDIALTVVQSATPANTPLSGAFVRASISATEFQDTKTDDMGVAHLKLNAAKGPFDVTVALAGFNAVSVLGVTKAIPGNIVLSAIGATPTFKEFGATGTIAGAGATHILQLDAWDWQTVVTKAGATSYSTKFEVSAGLAVPLPVAAIEVDPALTTGGLDKGTAVKGTITAPIVRPGAAAVIPIDMTTGMMPTLSTVKMNWPTTGVFTGALIKGFGSLVADMHIGTGIVEKLTTSEAAAAMFCGIANVDPTDNTILHLQTFGGDMSPDIAGTAVNTVMGTTAMPTDFGAVVYAHDLSTNNMPVLNIGALNKMNVGGMSLGDATIEVDSTGYDSVEIVVSSTVGMTVTPIWVIYAPGGKLASRGLPYLPGGVMLGDLGGDVSTASVDAQVVKYIKNSDSPWQAIIQDQSYIIGNAKSTTLDPTGR